MTFHLAAFSESIGTSVTNSQLNALTDDILNVSNNNFLPDLDLDLVFAASMGVDLTNSRIVSPSNRQITLPYILPQTEALNADQATGYCKYQDLTYNPMRLRGLEEFGVEVTDTSASGTTITTTIVGLQPSFDPAPRGTCYTMRGTSTTTHSTTAWTTLAITWADTLPEGQYTVVGLNVLSANPIAARCIFEGQTWRPGALCTTDEDNWNGPIFFNPNGALGAWGTVQAWAPPQIQVLSSAADTAATAYLQFIRTG